MVKMILMVTQYSMVALFAAILLLALLRVVNVQTFLIVLLCFVAFFSVKALDSSIKFRGIRTSKEIQVSSVKELCSAIQYGDIIGFHKPRGFTWYENVVISTCTNHYYHHGIVLERNNQKYFYHSYGLDYQQERIQNGNAKQEDIVGIVGKWCTICEPLESYMEFMNELGSTFCIKRSGIPVSYSEEINRRSVERLTSQNFRIMGFHVMNCCIGLGEYLSHLPHAIPNPYPYYVTHVFAYNPISITRFYPIRETLYYKVT
jgi:hypothetical protein